MPSLKDKPRANIVRNEEGEKTILIRSLGFRRIRLDTKVCLKNIVRNCRDKSSILADILFFFRLSSILQR